jgi:hypothetical protein
MAGPTDVLTEDVKEFRAANRELADEIKRVFDRLSGEMWNSNQRMADTMRESNQRLADAINRLAGDFGNFRVEVAKELGAINTNLETFKGRTETSLSVAKWAVGVSVPALIGLVIWSYSAYARAVRIEDSVLALKDHAKGQDERISKLIELRGVNEPPRSTPNPTVPPTLNGSPHGEGVIRDPKLEAPPKPGPAPKVDAPPRSPEAGPQVQVTQEAPIQQHHVIVPDGSKPDPK